MWNYPVTIENYTLAQYLVSWLVVFPVYTVSFVMFCMTADSTIKLVTAGYEPPRHILCRVWWEGIFFPSAALVLQAFFIGLFWWGMATLLDGILKDLFWSFCPRFIRERWRP